MSLKYLPVASEKTTQFHHRMIVKRKETKLTYLSTEKENCAVVDCEKCQCYNEVYNKQFNHSQTRLHYKEEIISQQ